MGALLSWLLIRTSIHEFSSQRIEPIGFDAKRNAYWLIGSKSIFSLIFMITLTMTYMLVDRLWIQREFPKRPISSTKRKAKNTASSRKAKVPRLSKSLSLAQAERASPSNRTTPSRKDAGNRSSKAAKPSRNSRRLDTSDASPSVPGSLSRARAAKTQANVKLDLQAKQLAAAKAEFDSLNRRSSRGSASRPLGTRLSRRLRGEDDDDDWQQIPPEWLEGIDELPSSSPSKRPKRSATRASTKMIIKDAPLQPLTITNRRNSEEHDIDNMTGLESDNESDLTELSDSETSNREAENPEEIEVHEDPPSDIFNHEENPENHSTWPPANFIEWETVSILFSMILFY